MRKEQSAGSQAATYVCNLGCSVAEATAQLGSQASGSCCLPRRLVLLCSSLATPTRSTVSLLWSHGSTQLHPLTASLRADEASSERDKRVRNTHVHCLMSSPTCYVDCVLKCKRRVTDRPRSCDTASYKAQRLHETCYLLLLVLMPMLLIILMCGVSGLHVAMYPTTAARLPLPPRTTIAPTPTLSFG